MVNAFAALSEFAELARRGLTGDTSTRHAAAADIGDMQDLSVSRNWLFCFKIAVSLPGVRQSR